MSNFSSTESQKNEEGPTILILIGGHLSTAPRPQKEAAVAREAGFHVCIRGIWSDSDLAAEDQTLAEKLGVDFRPLIDLRKGSSGSFRARVLQRLAREGVRHFGIVTPRAFGNGSLEMLREARRLNPSLTMVHSEAGLWVAKKLLTQGFPVGVDFEDWFSHDLLESARNGRPVDQLRQLERYLAQNANPVISTTVAMASAIAADAGCERIPVVVPNCFPQIAFGGDSSKFMDRRDTATVSFYWFSQTIGAGRGLEVLAKALENLRGNWQLHLRGNLRLQDAWFEATFPHVIRDRVILHGSTSNTELPLRSSAHDVGLALEIPYCRSRDLTATNKIFEYLRCGLAVVATDTMGQREVLRRVPKAGWIVASGDISDLTRTLQECIDKPAQLAVVKAEAATAGRTIWSWDAWSKVLQDALKDGATTIAEK